MGLNWSVRDCADSASLLREDGTPTPMTEAVIFMCMAVGVGVITAKNWREYIARMRMLGVSGIPAEDVYKCIGLRTNVTYEPPSRWLKRTYEGKLSDVRWETQNLTSKQA